MRRRAGVLRRPALFRTIERVFRMCEASCATTGAASEVASEMKPDGESVFSPYAMSSDPSRRAALISARPAYALMMMRS